MPKLAKIFIGIFGLTISIAGVYLTITGAEELDIAFSIPIMFFGLFATGIGIDVLLKTISNLRGK